MNMDALMAVPREDIPRAAEALNAETIRMLIGLLEEKADAPRYQALLLLTARSERFSDVSPHWRIFRDKLADGNSYQRSIGILLLAANARWIEASSLDEWLPRCLLMIEDEKPITARQAIQSLGTIALAQPAAAPRITQALTGLDILSVRESMRKSILLDACRALIKTRNIAPLRDSIDAYLVAALSGDILDKASKKEIREAMA